MHGFIGPLDRSVVLGHTVTETGRLETFADGVFAIAITLLVVFLLFIAFVPYPTAVLAQRLGSGRNALEATLLYGGTMVAIAIMFNAIWLYATARNGHLLGGELSPERRAEARGYRYGPPIYLAITALAVLSPILSLIGFLAFAAYWALPISGATNTA